MRACLLLLLFLAPGVLLSQNLNQVRTDVAELCSPALHGRGYAYDGSNKAAAYLVERFEEIGLQPVNDSYTQPFVLDVNVFERNSTLEIGGKQLVEGEAFIADPSSGISSGKYRLQNFDSTDFRTGRIPKLRRNRIPAVYMAGIDSPEEVSVLHAFQGAVLEAKPVLKIQSEKLIWGVGQRRYRFPLLEVKADHFPAKANEAVLSVAPEMRSYQAHNVIGYLPGMRSDSCIVITAHYDHLGRMGKALFAGANDNASGTATMLDLAAHFTENKPPMDLYFIAFAAEEAGLIGSLRFVQNPMIPLENIRFLINLDLLGSAAKGIVIVNGKEYAEVQRIGKLNKDAGLVPKIRLRGKAANSDHYHFSEAGVPAIFIYTEGNVTAYHDVNDLPEGLDWANYEAVFELLTRFVKSFE